MSLNDHLTLLIEKIVYGGQGLARLEGKVHLVSGVLPGEEVTVTPVKEKRSYTFCQLREVLKENPKRIPPNCPLACFKSDRRSRTSIRCPGCSYQHVDYGEEVALKHQQFEEVFEGPNGVGEGELLKPIPSPVESGYRNKLTLRATVEESETRLGYFMEDNVTVFDLCGCPLATPRINEALVEFRSKSGWRNTLRDGMKVTFRQAGDSPVHVWRNKPPKNSSWLKESTSAGEFSVPWGSFFQVNPQAHDLLLETVRDIIRRRQPELVVDLFCGIGVFGIAAALEGVPKVVGLDCDSDAIEAASYNARRRDLNNCEFRAGDAAKATRHLLKKTGCRNSLLITDPPRTGMHRKTLEAIIESNPAAILYVSCAIDTLHRDLNILKENGFVATQARMIDMFPRTSHFETVTLVEKT